MKRYSLIYKTSGLVLAFALSALAMGKKPDTTEPHDRSTASSDASQGRVNSDPYSGGDRSKGTGTIGTPMGQGSDGGVVVGSTHTYEAPGSKTGSAPR